MPSLIDAEPADPDVTLGPDAAILDPVVIRGGRNSVRVGVGARLGAFVPAGIRRDQAAGPALQITGEDNTITVGDTATLTLNITVRGDRNRIEIGSGCRLNGFVAIQCSDAVLRIGAGTTMVNGSLQLHEPGEIRIGEDCMIANQVYVSLSDIHPIYDRATGERVNPAASVTVADHVWLGLRSMVMKGSSIGHGAVVAAGAVVSGPVPAHCVVAGVPARVVREDIDWARDFDEAPRAE